MRRWIPIILTAALIPFRPSVVPAAVPSAADSHVDACLVGCPAGDDLFHVVVRDLAHNTIPNSVVTIDFSSCPFFPFCASATGPYLVDPQHHRISLPTDGNGVADFMLSLEGGCDGMNLTVFADGVWLAAPRIVLMDQDDDEIVSDADIAIAQGKVGTPDRTADVNCDGFTTSADVDIIAAHRSHACPRSTYGRRSHWGTLKIHYH